jgi:hypothetical protein
MKKFEKMNITNNSKSMMFVWIIKRTLNGPFYFIVNT